MVNDSKLTVIVLTFNEDKHIERCLKSAFQVAQNVFVVDSFSTDHTVSIAESLGARVWQHGFVNHALQLSWAIETLPIETQWVMRVDADEVISPTLAENINRSLSNAPWKVGGFLVCRYVKFMGNVIRHGNFPQWNLRIWRSGNAAVEQRWMDEHLVLKSGRAERLGGEFIDDNLNNVSWWTEKHNIYSTREAIELLSIKYKFNPGQGRAGVLSGQARLKRWLKDNFYSQLPLGLRALGYFIYRLFIQLGVLDGRAGFAFHFLQAFWYRFLVDVKVREVEERMRVEGIDCEEAIRREFGLNPVYATTRYTQSTE